jgi:UDP-glucose 4-epimerase
MKTFLVTGGAGFIGSHLVRALLARGDKVRVLDNFSTGKAENLAGLQGALEILEGDIRDAALVNEAVRGVEVIFHEAAFVSVPLSMETPLPCFETNVRGTEILLEAARHAEVRRVVLASSAAVYGDSDLLPLREDSPLHPLSPYAVSKRVDELYAALYTEAFGLEVVALRYFNVFGPRQSPNSAYAAAVPIFTRRMLEGIAPTVFGDGRQTRDLIYAGDVARANLLAADAKDAPGKILNICTGRETRLLDLLDALKGILPDAPPPEFAPPRAGDIYRSVGSPSLAKRILGFRAKISLEEGLRETVAWMKS